MSPPRGAFAPSPVLRRRVVRNEPRHDGGARDGAQREGERPHAMRKRMQMFATTSRRRSNSTRLARTAPGRRAYATADTDRPCTFCSAPSRRARARERNLHPCEPVIISPRPVTAFPSTLPSPPSCARGRSAPSLRCGRCLAHQPHTSDFLQSSICTRSPTSSLVLLLPSFVVLRRCQGGPAQPPSPPQPQPSTMPFAASTEQSSS
jgi:hypothetical protein